MVKCSSEENRNISLSIGYGCGMFPVFLMQHTAYAPPRGSTAATSLRFSQALYPALLPAHTVGTASNGSEE